MSNDDLTHENFDFRGFDVPDLKAVTLASSVQAAEDQARGCIEEP